VARKPKTPVENKPADNAAAPSANGKMSAPEPKKKAAEKKKKPAAAKKPSPKKPATSATKPAASRSVEPTDDEIRIRAYFLGERRHQLSLPGDSAHDWIEARRQLIEEANR
jgi:predicted lipid-binding transport protein (Tim44 family)